MANDQIPFEVRPARREDLEDVRRLLTRSALPLDGLDAHFGPSYAVAVSDGRLVGTAGIEVWGGHGLLRSAVVDAAWRGRGVGEALTRDRIAWAVARGLKALYLLTTTAADYFPRFGFRRVGREDVPAEIRWSPEFTGACPASAVAMALALGAEDGTGARG